MDDKVNKISVLLLLEIEEVFVLSVLVKSLFH